MLVSLINLRGSIKTNKSATLDETCLLYIETSSHGVSVYVL